MKQKFSSFRMAIAILAMASLGAAISSCSKDEGILADVELQSEQEEGISLKSMSIDDCDPYTTSDGTSMDTGYVYQTVFKRHYGGAYPYYVSEVFDFSTNQLADSITPDSTINSSAPATNGMITFFNQTAYKKGTAKGCPAFIVGDDYKVACYTALVDTSYNGLDSLRCLEKSDVTSLTFSGEGTSYSLPFLTSVDSSCFSSGVLQQSLAYAYYDSYLTIGRQFHNKCGGLYNEPIWVIRKSDGLGGVYYWAFCIDPYQNDEKYWSTINYKILD